MTATTTHMDTCYRISRLLHWLCAISFVLLVVSMPIMLDSANNSAQRNDVYMMHQSMATIFILLLLGRFAWMCNKNVTATKTVFEYQWQHFVAKTNHLILYFLMIFMPLTGLIDRISHGKALTAFNVQIIPETTVLMNKDVHFIAGEAHLWLLNLFYVLIAFHLMGALTHVFPRIFSRSKVL